MLPITTIYIINNNNPPAPGKGQTAVRRHLAVLEVSTLGSNQSSRKWSISSQYSILKAVVHRSSDGGKRLLFPPSCSPPGNIKTLVCYYGAAVSSRTGLLNHPRLLLLGVPFAT